MSDPSKNHIVGFPTRRLIYHLPMLLGYQSHSKGLTALQRQVTSSGLLATSVTHFIHNMPSKMQIDYRWWSTSKKVDMYLTTLQTPPIEFKTIQDILMKIAGTIAKFMRRVLKAKSCQQPFIKKHPGHLDKPHLIFKSPKS